FRVGRWHLLLTTRSVLFARPYLFRTVRFCGRLRVGRCPPRHQRGTGVGWSTNWLRCCTRATISKRLRLWNQRPAIANGSSGVKANFPIPLFVLCLPFP